MTRRGILVFLALGVAACQSSPQSFAPPVQRQPLPPFRAYRHAYIVNMADADASSHFVRDITGISEGTWRWAAQKPAVKVHVNVNQGLRYVIDFGLPEVTLKQTGPVTVRFAV